MKLRLLLLLALAISACSILVAPVFAQAPSNSSQYFQEHGKDFPSAYGVLPDGGGLYMEAMYLPAVTTGPWAPAWSPDGRSIAFSMQGSLWEVPAEGGQALQITSSSGYDSQPAWAPDGHQIAFVRDTDHVIQIWVMNENGSSRGNSLAPAR